MITYSFLESMRTQFGDSFYLMNSYSFESNYNELLSAYTKVYPKTSIAYSYKTNYTPHLCKLVNKLGGYAEVVSDMEYTLAKTIGVPHNKIFFNGPYKRKDAVEELLLQGGIVNIDSWHDLEMVCSIAQKHSNAQIKVGIRCNFDIGDGVVSRFGFDISGADFAEAFKRLNSFCNIKIAALHCHFATREINTFRNRAIGMIDIIKTYFSEPIEYVSIGGGLFGKMKDSLAEQFNAPIPGYDDYANESASVFRDYFIATKSDDCPILIIEPGSAIVGDVMCFVSTVVSIKEVRGKHIATLTGSIHNINPTLSNKRLPVTVIHADPEKAVHYDNLDFAGYTCIESDYLYKNYSGNLSPGDFVVFDNVGSYSIVLKPPFILPNFPVIDYNETSGNIKLVKRAENFEDIFSTFELN